MMNDILHALDNGDVTVVTLLGLSAAFDTIGHNILFQRLENLYRIFWYTSQLVQILPFQQNSVCYHQQQTFTANLAQLWRSTRLCLGTYSIHFVHKTSDYTHSTTLHF